MARAIIGLLTALVMLLIAVVVLGAFGFDPWKGVRRIVWDEPAITKQTIDEKREVRKTTATATEKECFAHQVWHAGWLNGDGDLNTALLVAVVTRNVTEDKSAPTDYCTVFTAGKAELPGKRTKETETSYIVRTVEVVSGQSSTKSRSAQYEKAEQVIERVLPVEDYRSLLPKELSHARCAKVFLRKTFGFLISRTAGSRDIIRAALVAEFGEPVHVASSGMEFFGKCQ